MHNNAHYRPTKNLRIPELKDRLIDIIHHQIIEIVFQYYEGTVMEERELNVLIVLCLERFLENSYRQLQNNTCNLTFICNQRPENQLSQHRGKALNTLLQLFTINAAGRFPDRLGDYRWIKSFTEKIQHRFEEFQ